MNILTLNPELLNEVSEIIESMDYLKSYFPGIGGKFDEYLLSNINLTTEQETLKEKVNLILTITDMVIPSKENITLSNYVSSKYEPSKDRQSKQWENKIEELIRFTREELIETNAKYTHHNITYFINQGWLKESIGIHFTKNEAQSLINLLIKTQKESPEGHFRPELESVLSKMKGLIQNN